MSVGSANLVMGLLCAAVVAGGLIVVTETEIALWKYALGVAGVLLFVFGGLSGSK